MSIFSNASLDQHQLTRYRSRRLGGGDEEGSVVALSTIGKMTVPVNREDDRQGKHREIELDLVVYSLILDIQVVWMTFHGLALGLE